MKTVVTLLVVVALLCTLAWANDSDAKRSSGAIRSNL